MFFGKKKNKDNDIGAFVTGTLRELTAMPDQVFAQKMMGDGYAIEPTDSTIVSPITGEVTVVFPTGHAYGITSEQGVEVLVHLGVDTVELGGEGFTSHVAVGDKVKLGDKIATMNLELIKEKGKPVISACIFTAGQQVTFLKVDVPVEQAQVGFVTI